MKVLFFLFIFLASIDAYPEPKELQDPLLIKGAVYKITNVVNGRVYIGLTTKAAEKRFREHPFPNEVNILVRHRNKLKNVSLQYTHILLSAL